MFSLQVTGNPEPIYVWFKRLALAMLWIAVGVGCDLKAFAQARLISAESLRPNVLVVGSSAPLSVSGSHSQDIDRLIFSDPRIQAEPISGDPLPGDSEKTLQSGVFQVTVPDDVSPGIYEVHAVGRYGVSNPRAVVVVSPDFQVVTLAENSQGESLPLNTLVSGYVPPVARVQFTIEASDKVRYLVCASIGLDSSLLPRIRVKNAKGNTIKSARWRDRSPIIIGLPADFSGQIELADEMYRGGVGYNYVIGCFSNLDHPLKYGKEFFPVASVNGMDLPEVPTTDLRLGPQNDSAAIDITPPTELLLDRTAGWKFRWTQAAGQVHHVEYLSASLGHSTDTRLSIYQVQNDADPSGTLLGVHEDAPPLGSNGIPLTVFDPSFLLTTPSDQPEARYLLHVDDLQSRSQVFDAASNPIRLRIAPPVPRFQCVAHWSPSVNLPATAGLTGSYLPANGLAAIHIIASRLGGFAGPIEVEVRNLPEGIHATRGIIQPNQTETFILVQNAEAGLDWIGQLEIVAKGTVGEAPVEKTVSAATIHIPATTERGAPQSRLASGLWLKASKQDAAPIKIRLKTPDLSTPAVLEAHAGEKVSIPLVATRTPEGLTKCLLRPKYLPPGASVPEIELAAEATEVAPELTIAKECVPGEYMLCFQGEMVWKQPGAMEAHHRHVAYRDRLNHQREAADSDQRKAELDALIAAANTSIEQLAKDAAPVDRTVWFYTAPVHLKVLPPKE